MSPKKPATKRRPSAHPKGPASRRELAATDLWDVLRVYLWIQLRDDTQIDRFLNDHLDALVAGAPTPIRLIKDYARLAKQPASISDWPELLLDDALKAGTVLATGRKGYGSRTDIAAAEWRDLRLCDWPGEGDDRQHAFPWDSNDVTPGAYFYKDVAFTRASVQAAFPSAISTRRSRSEPNPTRMFQYQFVTDELREAEVREQLAAEGSTKPSERAIAKRFAKILEDRWDASANWNSIESQRRAHRLIKKREARARVEANLNAN